MNKLSNILLLLFSPLIFTACTKEKTTEQEFRGLFKNTEWTGEIKYNNKPVAEPFSIEFSDNGTFKWHELSGYYPGTYTINAAAREVTLHLTASNGIVTATVTQDNKFTDISSLPDIYSCEFNNSGTQNLDETWWLGTTHYGIPFDIYFKYGQKLITATVELPYDRKGVALRFLRRSDNPSGSAVPCFFTIQPDNKTIKGICYNPSFGYFGFELSKQ